MRTLALELPEQVRVVLQHVKLAVRNKTYATKEQDHHHDMQALSLTAVSNVFVFRALGIVFSQPLSVLSPCSLNDHLLTQPLARQPATDELTRKLSLVSRVLQCLALGDKLKRTHPLAPLNAFLAAYNTTFRDLLERLSTAAAPPPSSLSDGAAECAAQSWWRSATVLPAESVRARQLRAAKRLRQWFPINVAASATDDTDDADGSRLAFTEALSSYTEAAHERSSVTLLPMPIESWSSHSSRSFGRVAWERFVVPNLQSAKDDLAFSFVRATNYDHYLTANVVGIWFHAVSLVLGGVRAPDDDQLPESARQLALAGIKPTHYWQLAHLMTQTLSRVVRDASNAGSFDSASVTSWSQLESMLVEQTLSVAVFESAWSMSDAFVESLLSPEDVALVQNSWRTIVAAVGHNAGPAFYELLFTTAPAVIPLFESVDMDAQSKHLISILSAVVEGAHNLPHFSGAVASLGRRHIKYGSLPEHFGPVGSVLLKLLGSVMQDQWTDRLQRAWLHLYSHVSAMMIAAMNRVLEPIAAEQRFLEMLDSERLLLSVRSAGSSLTARIQHMKSLVAASSFAYSHSNSEVVCGTRLAWRNSRIGPLRGLEWRNVLVKPFCDCVHATTMVDKLLSASMLVRSNAAAPASATTAAGGSGSSLSSPARSPSSSSLLQPAWLQSLNTITQVAVVFAPAPIGSALAHESRGTRIWNPSFVAHAGYQASPSSPVLGDAANLQLTETCIEYGWQPPAVRSPTDVLPLCLEYFDLVTNSRRITLQPIPSAPQVHLRHPEFAAVGELEIHWPWNNVRTDQQLRIGGLVYPATAIVVPWKVSEIVSALLSTRRYNMALPFAKACGISPSALATESSARHQLYLELRRAIQYTFAAESIVLLEDLEIEAKMRSRLGLVAEGSAELGDSTASSADLCAFENTPSTWKWRLVDSLAQPAPAMSEQATADERGSVSTTHKSRSPSLRPSSPSKRGGSSGAASGRMLVLFGSERGTTERHARKLLALLGLERTRLMSLDQFISTHTLAELENYTLVVFVVCSFVAGSPTTNAQLFSRSINELLEASASAKTQPLKAVRYTVFGFGSMMFENTYCAFSRSLNKTLARLGAVEMLAYAEADTINNEKALAAWHEWTAALVALVEKLAATLALSRSPASARRSSSSSSTKQAARSLARMSLSTSSSSLPTVAPAASKTKSSKSLVEFSRSRSGRRNSLMDLLSGTQETFSYIKATASPPSVTGQVSNSRSNESVSGEARSSTSSSGSNTSPRSSSSSIERLATLSPPQQQQQQEQQASPSLLGSSGVPAATDTENSSGVLEDESMEDAGFSLPAASSASAESDVAPEWSRTQPFEATVLKNRCLEPGEADGTRAVHLLTLDLANSEIEFAVGDYLVVLPENAPDVVQRLAARLGLELSDSILQISNATKPGRNHNRSSGSSSTPRSRSNLLGLLEDETNSGETMSVAEFLASRIDLQLDPVTAPELLEVLASYATKTEEREQLEALAKGKKLKSSSTNSSSSSSASSSRSKSKSKSKSKDTDKTPSTEPGAVERTALSDYYTVLEVLEAYQSIECPLSVLFTILPAPLPRYYSICSTPLEDSTQAQILVSVATVFSRDWSSVIGSGLCSSFLASRKPGDRVLLYCRRSMLPLPDLRATTPVVLCAAGTGVSPFYGVLREMELLARQSPDDSSALAARQISLIYGCRAANGTYWAAPLLQPLQNSGPLSRLTCAFSRGSPTSPQYVQDVITREAAWIYEQLHHYKGTFYFCGDSRIEASVRNALIGVWETQGKLTRPEAVHEFETLRAEQRYVIDIWGAQVGVAPADTMHQGFITRATSWLRKRGKG